MDALDAQNQQVQIELQRLYYKINMMDSDEESYEPELDIYSKSKGEHTQDMGYCEEDLAPDLGMYQSWNPRLSERFSPGREKLTWECEILGYTGGFSPRREMAFWDG
ncbi:hypothetical protein Lal_00026374 [Lupinus albus]|nr:hypothetical protein Lal_00026374 [Lupinus albus]